MLTHRNSTQNSDPQPGSGPQTASFAVVPPADPRGQEGGEGGGDACKLVTVNLSAYMDDELDLDQVRVIEAHLYQCPDCVANLKAMEEADSILEREWRDRSPLPSSSQVRRSIDNIMDALPPVPAKPAVFAPKRVHARMRWMRFAAGMTGMVAFGSLLWGSYELGYTRGRRSAQSSPSLSYFSPRLESNSELLPASFSLPTSASRVSHSTSSPNLSEHERP